MQAEYLNRRKKHMEQVAASSTGISGIRKRGIYMRNMTFGGFLAGLYDHRTSLFYRSSQRRSRTEMYRDRVQQQAGTGEQLLLSPQTVPKILYKFLLVGEFGQQFVLVLRKVIGKQLIRIIQL